LLPKQQQEATSQLTPEQEVLMPFKDLCQSKLVKCFEEIFGKQTIPLPLVGYLLNFIGNNLLYYIYQLYSNHEKQCKIFYPAHKAISI
jgi:hypothetical protein